MYLIEDFFLFLAPSSNMISETSVVNNTNIGNSAKIYRNCNIRDSNTGNLVTIEDESIIISSSFESNCTINRRNFIQDSNIGRYTYTGHGTTIRGANVGRFCSISWNVSIGGKNHPLDHVSTGSSWSFYNMDGHRLPGKHEYGKGHPECKVGNDVWIATNALILRGVEIGDGSAIVAGAVVTHNVKPFTIMAGVPVRPLRKRYSKKVIAIMQYMRWWEWPPNVIRDNTDLAYESKADSAVLEKLLEIKNNL